MRFDHNPIGFASLPPAGSRPAIFRVGNAADDDPCDPRLRRIAGRFPADLPVIIDLCCGDGGFAEGAIAAGAFVIGVDIVHFAGIDSLDPRRFFFLQADVISLPSLFFSDQRPVLVFSGAPCEEASRHKMPWTRKKNPPPPDLSIILENSQAMQQFIGKAAAHYGPHYLWGDVPAMLPHRSWYSKKKKESFSGSEAHLRARLPIELSEFLARSFIAGNQQVDAGNQQKVSP